MAKNKVDNFSNEELQNLINESSSFTELAKKIGYHTKSGAIISLIKRELENRKIQVNFQKREIIKRTVDNIFILNSSADQKTLRRWYLKGQYSEYKCSICGLEPFWNGKELTLTLDHINGNNKDDRLENLRWICPNCDRQLPTFGARNINNLAR